MFAVRKCFSSVGLMALVYEAVEPGVWNFLQRKIVCIFEILFINL